MKKYLIAFLVVLTGFALTSQVLKADLAQTGDVVIHFKTWSGDYEGLGVHGWNGISSQPEFDGKDDFGVFIKGKDIPITNEIGFIAVYYKGEADSREQDWDRKLTGDVKIAPKTLVAGETTHIYIFEGAESKEENLDYYVAKNNMYNMLLVYADPANAYEENIGVHNWGWEINADWGTPNKVFTDGSSHAAIPTIKIAMLHANNVDAGLLIYAGGDDSKKTGDVKLSEALSDTPVLGDVGFAYVISKGGGHTSNDNLFYDGQEFVDAAFTFSLLTMGKDSSGMPTGTFAHKPTQVFAELSAQVANPYKLMETVGEGEDAVEQRMHTDAEAKAIVEAWFTLLEGENELAIEEVQFANNDTLGSFVLILKEPLVLAKEYVLKFDDGVEGNENKVAEIELNLDKEAPKLVFIGPLDIVGKPAAERVITVEWGKKFDFSLFPRFRVTDDRDGDLTRYVWIPKGENSKIDTSKEGDYTILLKVEDTWGNVTEETFIFRVAKKAK